ncbi:MAG: hypothetical protein HY752_01515 [Nitrospirae bacterium]|nr:hypothetical protein [Nitrospirota bacterium]
MLHRGFEGIHIFLFLFLTAFSGLKECEFEILKYKTKYGYSFKVVQNPEQYCTACFNNNYPIFTPEEKVEQIALF